jgi:hypothetical protein
MMMTSFMVMGSLLWMEGDGLGLARNIVQRYAHFLLRRRGFRRPILDRPRDSAGQTIVIGAVLLGSTGRQPHQGLNGRLQELLRHLLILGHYRRKCRLNPVREVRDAIVFVHSGGGVGHNVLQKTSLIEVPVGRSISLRRAPAS